MIKFPHGVLSRFMKYAICAGTAGLLPKNWSRCYESLRAKKARRTLDETDATPSRADHRQAPGRGWDAGGRSDDRRGLPGPGHQRADLPALAPAVWRHEG